MIVGSELCLGKGQLWCNLWNHRHQEETKGGVGTLVRDLIQWDATLSVCLSQNETSCKAHEVLKERPAAALLWSKSQAPWLCGLPSSLCGTHLWHFKKQKV